MRILVLLFMSSFVHAQDFKSYGSLMIQDEQAFVTGFEAHVSLGYDVTNPYLNSFNADTMLIYNAHPLFSFGLESLMFSMSPNRYNQLLSSEIGAFGITANDDRPKAESIAIMRLKLLNGRVNLLGTGALAFKFSLKIGTGLIWNSDSNTHGVTSWGFEQQLFFTDHWATTLKFDQDVESLLAGHEIYRNRLGFGVSYLF